MTQDESQSLFRSEYRRELELWLRQRFRLLCITYLGLGAVHLLFTLFFATDLTTGAKLLGLATRLLSLGVIARYLFARDWSDASREHILGATTTMILIVGTLSLVAVFGISLIDPGSAPNLIVPIFFWHFSACLFLPWTPRESLRPFIALMIAWAVLVLLFSSQADIIGRVLNIVFGPGVLLPGLGVAAWRMQRHSRSFRSRMVGRQFVIMRREFTQAREIHENVFPSPYDDGFVKFEFTYRPMRDLGGDYIHLHVGAEGLVHLTLIDVTGHGLAAALTVNRLYGEMERIRGESPGAEPGEVLTLLNRYIHLTMARHNIYATAACVTLDPYPGRLAWASAGHPPGYLRGVNGAVAELAATTVPLGALSDDRFNANQESTDLSPGDTLILYTDGVFESRDRAGRQFGLKRLRALLDLRPAPRHWPQFIAAEVGRQSAGRTEDDILIAALTFCASRRRAGEAEPEEALTAT